MLQRFLVTVGVIAVLILFGTSELWAQTGDGYIGVYADSTGTSPCATVPQWSGKTLYVIAKTAGASADGITGAEFRVEVTHSSGWWAS